MKSTKARRETHSENANSELVTLGLESSFTQLPAQISIGGASYFLVRLESGYQLLSTVCPHQGGQVEFAKNCYECPHHGWSFGHIMGTGINNTKRMSSLPVVVRDGQLYAEISIARETPKDMSSRISRLDQLSIGLHAHACLEVRQKEYTLLMDPWLSGPAFLGSWIHYPPHFIDVSKLQPDTIVITHEHSDHFHEPTLRQFDRSVSIYVPDFPNRRIAKRLERLGFLHIHPVAFGETHNIRDKIQLTFFEPISLWNDSIALLEINDFKLLNLNDAGLNQRVAKLTAPVDVIASQFSAGASGYPLTWSHLADSDKIHLMEKACKGKLQMLKEATALYGARYLIPFASFFTLWHTSHRKYVSMMKTNSIADVVQEFKGSKVRVIDMLPGDSWNVSADEIKFSEHRQSHKHLFRAQEKLQYLDEKFNAEVFEKHHPLSVEITEEGAEAYFLKLNETPEIVFCEDISVRIRAIDENDHRNNLDISFEVAKGQLQILPKPAVQPNVSIQLPKGILREIVEKNISWDEAHIGYWCQMTRSAETYHAGFWRLLQAPYFNKPADIQRRDEKPISGDSVIADILEQYGERALRILGRYGLYCSGCHYSTFETLMQGAFCHGIEEGQIDRLVRELNTALLSKRAET